MKKMVTIVFVLMGVVFAGCNTVQGIGKDVEKAGEAIQRTTR